MMQDIIKTSRLNFIYILANWNQNSIIWKWNVLYWECSVYLQLCIQWSWISFQSNWCGIADVFKEFAENSCHLLWMLFKYLFMISCILFLIHIFIYDYLKCYYSDDEHHCPACRTTLVATRFWVVMICPIIKCLTVLRVFFYFVWFVFIHHNFQFYFELCTYCNILDIYLS